jgi:hypothetical protein
MLRTQDSEVAPKRKPRLESKSGKGAYLVNQESVTMGRGLQIPD